MIKAKLVWSKGSLDNGAVRTQPEWIVWCKAHNYRLPTIAELMDYFRTLRGEELEAVKKDLRESWLITADTWYNLFTLNKRPIGLGGVDFYNSNYGYAISNCYVRGRAIGVVVKKELVKK